MLQSVPGGGTGTLPLYHSHPCAIGLELWSRVWKPGLREWSEGPVLDSPEHQGPLRDWDVALWT